MVGPGQLEHATPHLRSLNCKHLRQNVLGLFKIRAQLLHVVHSPIYCFPDQTIFQSLRSDKQCFSSSLCAGLTHWLELFPSNSSHAGLGPPHHAFSPSTLCPPAFLSMNTLSLRARTPSERGDWDLKKAQGFFSSWHLHLIYRTQFGTHRSHKRFSYCIWQTTRNKCDGIFCSHFPSIFSFLGAISSGFRLEESPFVPYDFMNSSTSPASPPGSIGDGWPRAKSPNGSSSVNWPPGKCWHLLLWEFVSIKISVPLDIQMIWPQFCLIGLTCTEGGGEHRNGEWEVERRVWAAEWPGLLPVLVCCEGGVD